MKLNRRQQVSQEYAGPRDPIRPTVIKKLRNVKKEIPNTGKMPTLDKLSKKQGAFVLEYLKDYNGLKAALRAGYAQSSAHTTANSLLRNMNVCLAINEYEKDMATRFISTKEKILKEMSIIAHSDIADYTQEDADGIQTLKRFKDLPPQVSRAIKRFSFNRTIDIKLDKEGNPSKKQVFEKGVIELYDKKAALELMGREVGMFKNKMELTGADGQPLIPKPTTIIMDFNE